MPKQKYTITITQAHIDEAVRRFNNNKNLNVCGNCPIAIAAKEQINPELRVTLEHIYHPATHLSFDLPLIGKQIAAIGSDSWHILQPTSFEVESNE
jgi:hypothetical protein